MKTLKIGALALGMMFAGSVLAMDERKTAENTIEKLADELVSIADKTTNKNLKLIIEEKVTEARQKVSSLLLDKSVDDTAALQPLEALIETLTLDKAYINAIATSVVSRTSDFIKTHSKKLGLVAALAVVGLGYVAYKKFTAKKKIKAVEEIEIEDEVTVE